MAKYREHFSKVDIFNKSATGHGSISRHLQTKKWDERFFFGLVSMSVTNTFKAYNYWLKR
jgi:hypothetical protein